MRQMKERRKAETRNKKRFNWIEKILKKRKKLKNKIRNKKEWKKETDKERNEANGNVKRKGKTERKTIRMPPLVAYFSKPGELSLEEPRFSIYFQLQATSLIERRGWGWALRRRRCVTTVEMTAHLKWHAETSPTLNEGCGMSCFAVCEGSVLSDCESV